MPQSRTRSMQALSVGGEFRFARCWDIERTDATHFRFTEHDQPLVVGDNTYTPANAMDATAVQQSDGTEPDNFKAFGIIDSTAIAQADLEAGLFRGAKVTEYVVDHRYPWAGVFALRVYYISNLTYNTETQQWEAEVAAMMHKLQQTRGGRFSKTCRWDLYSTQCGVTKASFTNTITVATVTDNKNFTATPSANDEADFYDDGTVEWSTGSNTGVVSPVKVYGPTGKTWKLQIATPYDIQVGDQANVVAGCNKLSGINEDGTLDGVGNCLNKFANLNNFGGFPFIPGNDRWLWSPDTKREDEE